MCERANQQCYSVVGFKIQGDVYFGLLSVSWGLGEVQMARVNGTSKVNMCESLHPHQHGFAPILKTSQMPLRMIETRVVEEGE